MVKGTFVIFLLIPIFLSAQQNKSYTVFNIKSQTFRFDSSIKIYASQCNHRLQRDFSLDSIASLRASYFLKVAAETAKKVSLDELFDHIPKGSLAHSRFFGTPGYFKEPENIQYQEALPRLEGMGLYVKAEIMQQEYWSGESKTLLEDNKIINNALRAIESSLGRDYLLSSYKESKEHNMAIVKYGNGKYGTSTKILISKEFDQLRGVWEYETLVINCTSFTKEIQ